LGDPEQTLQADIHDCDHNKTAVKNKNPVPELLRNGADVNDQALVAHGRPKWLPLEDSDLGPGGYTYPEITSGSGLSLIPRLYVWDAGV